MILADSFLFPFLVIIFLKIINLLCLVPLYSTLLFEHLLFASHQVLQLKKKTSILTITHLKDMNHRAKAAKHSSSDWGSRFNAPTRWGARLTRPHTHCKSTLRKFTLQTQTAAWVPQAPTAHQSLHYFLLRLIILLRKN